MSTVPYLYILVRTDVASMNPGKMAAQCAHASNDFMEGAVNLLSGESFEHKDELGSMIFDWKDHLGTQMTYGTTIVLDGIDEPTISSVFSHMHHRQTTDWNNRSLSGVIVDPSYPIRDGKVTHHLPLLTCGWVFTRKNNLVWRDLSNQFNLRLLK